MLVTITEPIVTALRTLHDVPDELRVRIDGITPANGAYAIKLTEDEATSMAELVQWHMRTDPTTGKPTPQSAALGELISLIDKAMF